MNWKQIYACATPLEREEIVRLLVKQVLAHPFRAHYIGARRAFSPFRSLAWLTFGLILTTVTVTAFLMVRHIPPAQAVQLILAYDLGLMALLYFKPHKRRAVYA